MEISLFFVSHTCLTPELNPSFPTGANWCAIQNTSVFEAWTLTLQF